MATLYPFLVSFILLFSLSFMQQCVTSGSSRRGLSIKLIHRDSPESPIYPGNISSYERLERDRKLTQARMKSITLARALAKNYTARPNDIKAPVGYYKPTHYYFVKAGIGTFANRNPNYQEQFLIFDTGSSLIWTQCKGCDPCYDQDIDHYAYYDYENSQTYRRLPCRNDGDCIENSCVQGFCEYIAGYADRSNSYGKLGYDRFTFDSDDGGVPESFDILFGCGFRQTGFLEFVGKKDNMIGGILGMDADSPSLPMQFGAEPYSFCLPQPDRQGRMGNAFLKFGEAAIPRAGSFQTRITTQDGFIRVNLLDISVGTDRLNFPPGTFNYDPAEKKGGCEIDLGSYFPAMHKAQLDVVKSKLQNWYAQFPDLEKVAPKDSDGLLCYRPSNNNFNSYQTITLHIENAQMTLNMNQVYTWQPDKFCLGIEEAEENFPPSVFIGNLMLTDRRFVINYATRQLSFTNEVCND